MTDKADRSNELTIEQAASVSGVHRATIYEWIAAGDLAPIAKHGKRRIRRSDLEAFLARRLEDQGRRHRPSDLLGAHRAMLREAFDFFALAQLRLDRIGRYVPYAIFLHLLQRGRSLDLLLNSGYVEAAKPVARAMIGAALNIVAILDADSDGRALQFVVHQRPLRKRGLDRLVDHHLLTRERATQIDTVESDLEDKALAGWAAAGITPLRLGKGTETWSGLTDRQLADRMKASHWYDLYYGPFSDMGAHGNVGAVAGDLASLIAGAVTIGPRPNDPTHVVMASVEAIGESLQQLDRHLGTGRVAEAKAIREKAWSSVLESIRGTADERRAALPDKSH